MLKGAIIGIGKIAQTAHLPAFSDREISSRAHIIAAVDPSEESRKLAAERYPGLRFVDSLDRLLQEEKIDFIDICAPPRFHPDLIELGLSRGLHILCEKPLSLTVEQAWRITRSVKKHASLTFVPCHQYRYSLVWKPFKAFVDEIGTRSPVFIQFNVYRTQADPGFPSWNPAWRTDRNISGGGILADTGVHYLYLALWMMGVPSRVTAHTSRLKFNINEVEDTAVVLLESPRGLVEINLTWGADRRANSARAVCSLGSMVYDGSTLVRYTGDRQENLPVPDASDKSHYVSLYVSLFEEFLAMIEQEQQQAAWIDEAFHSIELLHASYRSASERRTITVTSGL